MEERSFLEKCRYIFSTYIRSNLLDATIIGATNAVFLAVMGLPHILSISLVAGLSNLIPTFGPLLGLIVGCLLLVFYQPISALWFLLFTVVLQLIDSYFIKPKLFGSTLGVPSFLVLVVTLVGGWFFGLWGILFAVPVAAILLMLWRDRRKRQSSDEAAGDADDAATDTYDGPDDA